MDEVKRWDLEQLPGYEAIEKPKKEDQQTEEETEESEESEEENYKISLNDLNIIKGEEPDFNNPKGKELLTFSRDYLLSILNKGNFNENKYSLLENKKERLLKVIEKKNKMKKNNRKE